ncbi:MAG: chloride channel protein [Parvibaculales bacterium]
MPTGASSFRFREASENSFYLILSLFMGGAGAFGAQGFKLLIDFFQKQFSSPERNMSGYLDIGFIGTQASIKLGIFLFIIAALIALVLFVSRLQKFYGVADTIEAARRPNAQVDIGGGLYSTLIASLSIAGGAPVGQYGPLVHFGATLATIVSRYVNLTRNASEVLLACGVAGVISAAFGAPIAAILFVHEVVLRHFSLRTFAPVTLASVVAYVVMLNLFPIEPFLSPINLSIRSADTILLLILTGLGGGMLAALFMQICLRSELATPKIGVPFWCLPFIGAVLLWVVGIYVPQILGQNIVVMKAAISGDIMLGLLILFCLLKLLMAALSISFGFYAGVFAPALFIGLMFGAAFGQSAVMVLDMPPAIIGLLALAGMGALISSTIGAPISTIIIVFELTHDYTTTIGVMVSIVFANLASNRLFGRSLFDRKLLVRGVDMSMSRGQYKFSQTPIKQLVSQDYCALTTDMDHQQALRHMVETGFSEAYIIDEEKILIGKTDLQKLVQSEDNQMFDQFGQFADFVMLREDTSILEAMAEITDFIGESLPVVSDNGDLLGIITEADIFRHYLSINEQSHAEENVSGRASVS